MLKGKAAIMATVILAVASAGPALAQTPGDIAKAPLSAMLQAAMLEGVRAQVIFSADVKVQPMLHFPPQRGDNGRVCGEVIENTPEGERVLKWAHLILDNWQGLTQELGTIRSKKGELVGRLVLGVIPSAQPKVSLLTRAMEREHPRVEFTVLSQSSEEILRNLHEHAIEITQP